MKGDFWLTMQEHAARTTALKNADRAVQFQWGRNHSLGLPTEWSNASRSGARWTEEENNALSAAVETLYNDRQKQPLGALEIAQLAWKIGRSANAVNEQLYKLFHGKSYFRMIKII